MLDQEAHAQFENFLTRYFYKVTDAYFKEVNGDNFSVIINADAAAPNEVVEIRGMIPILTKETPSAADQDNGINWKGKITIIASDKRAMHWVDKWDDRNNVVAIGYHLGDLDWGKWVPFTPVSLTLQHQNNQWSFIGLTNFHKNVSTEALDPVLLNIILLRPVHA